MTMDTRMNITITIIPIRIRIVTMATRIVTCPKARSRWEV